MPVEQGEDARFVGVLVDQHVETFAGDVTAANELARRATELVETAGDDAATRRARPAYA